jgi:hypothetical protein
MQIYADLPASRRTELNLGTDEREESILLSARVAA